MFYRADRFGMREGVLAHGRNWNLHAIVFGHFPGRFQKRIVRAEIYQRSLQRLRVSAQDDLRALAKRAGLRPATAQSKIINLEQL